MSTSHVASNHGPAPSPIALQPDEGDALWFMDFLATIKASAEETGATLCRVRTSSMRFAVSGTRSLIACHARLRQ